MDPKETGLGWDVDWIDMAQDNNKWWAVVSTVINFWISQNARKFLNIWGTISFSRSTKDSTA
jgi:hypothetical protein